MRRVFLLILLLVPGLLFASSSTVLVRTYPYMQSGYVDRRVPGLPTACWNFQLAVGANYNDDCSGVPYTLTVNGAPTRVNDATWLNTFTGAEGQAWQFDGAADYLSRADTGAGDIFDPGGSFSLQVAVMPHTIAAGEDCIMAKWETTGNQRGWKLCRDTAGVVLSTSVDGTVITTVTAANCFAYYRSAFITATYNETTTTGTIYCDNLATATNAAMSADIFNNTAPFEIGSSDTGATFWDGLISDAVYKVGVVFTETQHDLAFTQWQGRVAASGGYAPTAVASASPPAIRMRPFSGTEPAYLDQPANSYYAAQIVAGSGGLYGASALTSKWWRGSCETDDGAGHCQNWAVLENQGAGAATVVIDRITTTAVHGAASAKFTADNGGLPKYAYLVGACQTNWIGQDLTEVIFGKTLSGTASCALQIYEYDTAICTTFLAETNLWGLGNPGVAWARLKGTMAAAGWNVATSSWRPGVRCNATGTAYEVTFDAAMAVQAASTWETDALAVTDADADAITTAIAPTITTPIGTGAWTIEGTWRSPQAAGATRYSDQVEIPGTAGNNNRVLIEHFNVSQYCYVWDGAGIQQWSNINLGGPAADTDYDFKCIKTDAGVLTICGKASASANWICDATPATGATQLAINATTYIGINSTSTNGMWVRNVKFYRRAVP